MGTVSASYTLRDRGTDLRVETWVDPDQKQRNRARLLVDGAEVDETGSDEIGHVELGQDAGHPTRVAWWWTGRVSRCVLVEPGHGDVRRRSVPYAPPVGTRAARVHAWGEAHPNLYAARHVIINVGGTILAILGVGALLRAIFGGLLPRIDLGWLPDLDAPDWLRYLDLARYLAPVFEWVPPLLDRLFGWIPEVETGWLKYVVGFVVAVSIAVREARRRKRVAAEDSGADQQDGHLEDR
ncbi:MAG: hypothetical protein JWR85_2509 [Marmoricola sp.]|nr:hypothetical protein [Marmoricola sp.]